MRLLSLRAMSEADVLRYEDNATAYLDRGRCLRRNRSANFLHCWAVYRGWTFRRDGTLFGGYYVKDGQVARII